jgi:hypothetical protein
MKIRLYRSFGEIEIEMADDKEAIAQASFWSELPNNCPLCGAELFLHYRETKDDGYKYYELHCRGDKTHYTQFGQYKTGGLFYKQNAWAERTFNSYQDERDAEINKFDQQPSLGERIEKGIAAIKKLGGTVSPQGKNESDKDYLESLLEQHSRLSKK